jgi:hypothetical protein
VAYLQLYSELLGYLPKLSPQLAKNLVNRAWRDIRDARLWSFNTREAVVLAPSIVTAGTVTVTQYANTVTFDATALAAINLFPSVIPVTTRQFRVGSGGPIYSITAWNSVTGVATLDRMYAEPTASAQTYSIYKCYYPAPESGFVRWVSFFDPINAYPLRLHRSKSDFDKWDPQRGALGLPVYIGAYREGLSTDVAANLPLFEAWPHPTSALGYMTLYEVRGADLVADADALPFAIPDDLVTRKARWRAYEWAEANKGSHPELQSTNWLPLMKTVDDEYQNQLRDVIRSDAETFLTGFTDRQRQGRYPNTGQFLASHDVGESVFSGG